MNNRLRETGKVALAGLALAVCVPPLPLGPLVPLVLTAILGWLAPKTPGKAALAGFLSGLVFHVATLHWIKNVMNVGPPVTIALGVGLLIAYLSAFHALWAWLWSLCLRRDRIWAWPLLFTGIELVRGWGTDVVPLAACRLRLRVESPAAPGRIDPGRVWNRPVHRRHRRAFAFPQDRAA